jgi:F420H(2)-dependent quinone reductase
MQTGSEQLQAWLRRRLVRFWSRTMSQLHVRIYRATGGRLGSRRLRNRILLLQSLGHRTGQLHTVPLAYSRTGDGLVIAAGNVAFGRTPHWLRNIRANPQVEVTLGRETAEMVARQADAEERVQLWPIVARGIRGIALVERRFGRPIPIVVLLPLVDARRL